MIVITGGAGFIGSNLVRALNDRGRSDLLVVDDLEDGRKFRNLVDCEIADLIDKDAFLELVEADRLPGLVQLEQRVAHLEPRVGALFLRTQGLL